jgi:hypothetical protein
VEVVEEALVQSLCVLASSGQPAGDGRLLVAEDLFSRGNRLASRASADGGACRAWHHLVSGKTEEGASKDAKTAPERG